MRTEASALISVVICTHNPNAQRLQATLQALATQSEPGALELLLIDNASTSPISIDHLPETLRGCARVVREETLGLSYARARGFREAVGELLVLVDDDNLLAPDYLRRAREIFATDADLCLAGGPCRPRFEREPAPELAEFNALLALRDLGDEVRRAPAFRPDQPRQYPDFAPIGAGMILRRAAALAWAQAFAAEPLQLSDRRGNQLSSSGDNDIVLRALACGFAVGYFPELAIWHLIPETRVRPDYLARLNEGIQRSWMQVLSRHQVNPWPRISKLGAWARIARAYLRYRPWQGDAQRIRFHGAKGHFLGRVA